MKKNFLLVVFFIFSIRAIPQSVFPVNGIKKVDNDVFVFKNANITIDENTVLNNAILIVSKGKIVDVGSSISIPKNAIVYDLKGKNIYPSFIDMYTNYGVLAEKENSTSYGGPQYETKQKGAYYWNEAVRPEQDAARLFNANATQAEELRSIGFGAVNTFVKDGIVRGTSAIVTLSDQKENYTLLNSKVATVFSFNKGSSRQEYPSSLMGAIALLRQTYLDAEWFEKSKENQENSLSLYAFNQQKKLPSIFEANDKWNIVRADKIGDEFGVQYIFKTNGNEYQRIEEVKSCNGKLIVPINFPQTPDVENPAEADLLELDDLKHWEMAPYNLSILEKNNLQFAITTSDLKSKSEFFINLRKAIDMGLSKKMALKALTTNPAQLLNVSDKLGAIKKGYIANFIISSGDIFEKNTYIVQNWVNGIPYGKNNLEQFDFRGNYALVNSNSLKKIELKIEGEINKLNTTIKVDTLTRKSGGTLGSYNVSSTYLNCGGLNSVAVYEIKNDKDEFFGKLYFDDGKEEEVFWKKNAEYISEKKDSVSIAISNISITYPNMAYGFGEFPKEEKIVFSNVTAWTNEEEGILKNVSVLVDKGKIAAIGEKISIPADARIINGTGLHLTSGIIDEHSHIAISSGVNEGSNTATAEVRIGDVINSDDINIYRQLSGGVIGAQLLHGSANAIGGQSALIKLRWGLAPEKMKIAGADGFIKFALGENVKQSNWGERHSIRYPQSRMGVEQVYVEYFSRAREYQQQKKNAVSNTNFRRDLLMESLVEILEKKRFITCHSYQQGEINMLMHVADSFGFRVNTFTHILEGYKVADKMKKHGVGASTFSDWWAYKFEVNDAIPYNAAILSKMGIVTAINSDDAEMGRRLNQEAAKAVKYGEMTEVEAWKMVTLNPAKLLHLDKITGSIKVGKDADLVLWSHNPLSVMAKVETTMIDGRIYYDAKSDVLQREIIRVERQRILNLMIKAKRGGDKTEKPKAKNKRLYHCDDLSNDTYLDELY
jgi:imidazolonepropionase-like amidohydrolase